MQGVQQKVHCRPEYLRTWKGQGVLPEMQEQEDPTEDFLVYDQNQPEKLSTLALQGPRIISGFVLRRYCLSRFPRLRRPAVAAEMKGLFG